MSAVRVVPIAEFCATGSGGTPSRDKATLYYEGGSIPWVKSGELREDTIFETEERITDLALRESSVKLVPAGALLLAMYGATVGRLATLGVDATTNQAVCHIIPDPAVALTRYVFHALRSQVDSIVLKGVGGAQPNISQAVVRNIRIPLPPLPEQRRIAEILDRADALRAKRRAAIAQLDTLTQSIFLDMFGDPATNPKRFKKQRLSSLVRDGDTINYGVVQPGDEVDDGVPLVRVGDLRDGEVDTSNLKRISPSIESKYKRSRLNGNEILVSCVGSTGVVALADERLKGFNIARAVARISLDHSVNREYVANYLRSASVQRYFATELRTVSQPTLNIKQISETEVLIPPESMQEAFSLRIAAIRRMKCAQTDSSKNLDLLFESLQHDAFQYGI